MKTYKNGIVGNFPNGFKGWGESMNRNLKIVGLLQNLTAIAFSGEPIADGKEGDIYLTPSDSNWGRSNSIMHFTEGQWEVLQPVEGQLAYVVNSSTLTVYTGDVWLHGVKIFRTEDEEKAHFAALLNEIRPEPLPPTEP